MELQTGFMDDGAKTALLGTWMALFVIFAGRKFTQPIKVPSLLRGVSCRINSLDFLQSQHIKSCIESSKKCLISRMI